MRASGWRGFPLYWSGRAASQFGDQITLLALPWLVADRTASPLAVGALEALVFAPMLVLGLPIGAIADRRSRRRSMIESDTWRLLLLLSIPVLSAADLGPSLAYVLIVAFLVGVGNALFEASAQPYLTELVPRQSLVRANSRLSLTEALAEVLGPATAGVLIASLGAAGALAVDAATFGVSVAALLAMQRVIERHATVSEPMGQAVREGIRFLVRTVRLRTLMLLQAGANFGSGMAAGVMVFFLQRTLHLEGWEAGLVFTANGAGGVAASGVCTPLSRRIGLARTFLTGTAVAAAGFLLTGLAVRSSWFVVATGGMALVGLGVVTVIISATTLRQQLVPSELLGRVTTSYRTAVNGAVALGALTGGALGQVAGVRAALLTGGALYGVIGVSGFLSNLNAPDPEYEPAA